MGALYKLIPAYGDCYVAYPNAAQNYQPAGLTMNVTNSYYGTPVQHAAFVFDTRSYLPANSGIKVFDAVLNVYGTSVSNAPPGSDTCTLNRVGGQTVYSQSQWTATWNNMGPTKTASIVNFGYYPNSRHSLGGLQAHIQWDIDQGGGYWWLIGPATNYTYAQFYTQDATPRPNNFIWFDVYYGYNLSSIGPISGVRQAGASWGAVPGADSYAIYFNGVFQGQTYATSWAAGGVHSGNYTTAIYPSYNGYGNAGGMSTVGTSSVGQCAAPSISSSSRKKITLSPPAQYYSNNTWDYYITHSSGYQVSVGSQTGAYTFDLGNAPDGNYTGQAVARWNDGDTSAASGASAAVAISSPTITGIQITSQPRAITVQWDRISDMTSYNIRIDGGSWVSITNPSSGSTVSYTFASSSSTYRAYQTDNVTLYNHTIDIVPVLTGYTGTTINGAVTNAHSMLPTPAVPTVVGDNPSKRQISITPPTTRAAFYSAVSWDIRRDSNNSTIVNSASDSAATLSAVPAGTHAIEIRGRWTAGASTEYGPWSPVTSVTTTSPNPTSVGARQTHAPNQATISLQSGGTLTVGDYFVAVSVNKGTSRQTATINATTRAYNESTISPMPVATQITATTGNQTIRVTKPTNCTGSDTWNVYASAAGGTRNILKRVATSITSSTATYDISTVVTVPSTTDAKVGKVDLSWIAPTGAGDNPTTYRIERAPSLPPNVSNGIPDVYADVTTISSQSGIYSTTNFFEDLLDTKYWFYRISVVYTSGSDTSSSVEIVVSA